MKRTGLVLLTLFVGTTLVLELDAADRGRRRRAKRSDWNQQQYQQTNPVPTNPTQPTLQPATATQPAMIAASIGGMAVQIERTSDRDLFAVGEPKEVEQTGFNPEQFRGRSRVAAKLSVVSGEPEKFDSLESLLRSLKPDADMAALNISKDDGSARVSEESKNVQVTTYLYAARRDRDGDFHFLLGDANGNTKYLNTELSALPESGDNLDALKQARDQCLKLFGSNTPGEGYDYYKPAIPVRVTGSLFFDAKHHPTTESTGAGTKRIKPLTAWEIHPITEIEVMNK